MSWYEISRGTYLLLFFLTSSYEWIIVVHCLGIIFITVVVVGLGGRLISSCTGLRVLGKAETTG